jgi:cell division protein FtsL
MHRQLTDSFSFNHLRTLLLYLGLAVLIVVLYLGQSTQATYVGRQIRDLQLQKEQLLRANEQLQVEIAQRTNPAAIAQAATNLGLHPPKEIQIRYRPNIKPPAVIASPARPMVNPPVQESAVIKWWNDFLSWLGWGSSPRTAEASR